jgi:hypothetical protein
MPDEPGGESIAGVKITVTGDFSQADQAFQAAVARYVEGGKTMAEAIAQSLSEIEGVSGTAAEAVSNLTAVSERMGAVGTAAAERLAESIRAAGAAARNASLDFEEFGSALDATGQNAAMAGENFGGMAERATGSFRGMVSELRLFRGLFMVVMLPEMIANAIEGIVKWAKAQKDALVDSELYWREFNESLQVTNASMEVSNAQLENQLAKLRGEPENKLKVALLETAAAGAKMALDLDKAFDQIQQHLEKGKGSTWAALLRNLLDPEILGGGPGANTHGATEIIQTLTDGISDLQEKLKSINITEGGFSDLPHQLALINDEIVEVRGSLNKLYAEPETPTITKEIKSLLDLLKYLQNQLVQVKDAAKNVDLKGQVGTQTDSNQQGERAAKGWEAFYKRLDQEAAETTKILLELQKAQQGVADEKTREQGVMDKAWDKYVEGGQKAVAKTTEIIALKDRLSPAMYQTVNDLMNLPKAFADLHLHVADEELAKMASSLEIIKRVGSAADLAEGWRNYGAALAKAAVESRDFSKNLAGAAFQEIPRMFGTIESSLANDIVHWKGWATTVKSIFSQLATDALQIFLHALLAPLENMLTSALSGILSGLFKGGGAGGGGGDGGLGSDLIEGALSIVPFFAEGTDWVPRTGLAMLHEGEAVVPRSENVSNRYSTANYEHNASVGTHFDFRGSSFTGVTQDLVSNVMDKAVKMSRRSGAKW